MMQPRAVKCMYGHYKDIKDWEDIDGNPSVKNLYQPKNKNNQNSDNFSKSVIHLNVNVKVTIVYTKGVLTVPISSFSVKPFKDHLGLKFSVQA